MTPSGVNSSSRQQYLPGSFIPESSSVNFTQKEQDGCQTNQRKELRYACLRETTSHRYSSEASGSEGCLQCPCLGVRRGSAGFYLPPSAHRERHRRLERQGSGDRGLPHECGPRNVERQGVQHRTECGNRQSVQRPRL